MLTKVRDVMVHAAREAHRYVTTYRMLRRLGYPPIIAAYIARTAQIVRSSNGPIGVARDA